MASIIRSPAISEEKRKLSTRRARASADTPATAPVEATLQEGQSPSTVSPKKSTTSDVKDLVEQARLAVLNQFKEEAEEAREMGRQRGLREGRLAGTEEAKETFTAEFARIRSVGDKLHQAVLTGIRGVEDMAVSIAFEAVCKMMGSAAVTRDGIHALVKQAAQQATSSEKVVVRLHPADYSLLKDAGALEASLPSGTAVSWTSDKAIELGGCIVETDGGELDARLETQMTSLRRALAAARQSPSVPNEATPMPDRRKATRANFSPERRKKPRRRGEA